MPKRRRGRESRAHTETPRTITPDEWLNSKCSSIYCTTPSEPVTRGPDPYDMEIHGDETPVALCRACRHKRYMET